MKLFLIIIVSLFSLIGYAQFPAIKPGEQAVLNDCLHDEDPYNCTHKKLSVSITALITPEINTSLINSSSNEYFNVYILFITDEKGKVVPETTKVLCENGMLHKSIETYINSLSTFTPKDKKNKERRSAHTVDVTFIANADHLGFHLANSEEQNLLKIVRENIPLDTAINFGNCTEIDTDPIKCFIKQLHTLVSRNYKVPETSIQGKMKLRVTFYVNTKGKIVIDKITGGDDSLQKELVRVMMQLPTVRNGLYHNIPVIQHFALPVTLNL